MPTHTIIKSAGSNLLGNLTANTVLQASTRNGQNPASSSTNNALGKLVDKNGTEAPNLNTNSATNQNFAGVNSTVNNTLNFNPFG